MVRMMLEKGCKGFCNNLKRRSTSNMQIIILKSMARYLFGTQYFHVSMVIFESNNKGWVIVFGFSPNLF